MGRVVAIGLDSGSREIVDALARQGGLPALGTLRRRSARFDLRSGPAHRHGMLWPQFVNGRPARLDGEWLRLTFDPAGYATYQEPALAQTAGSPPFWERARVPTVLLDVPRTTCGGPGVQVTAWGAHAPLHPRAANPEGLLDEIDARFGVHPACGNDYGCGWHDTHRLDRLTRALVEGAGRRARIARHLQERFPSDLFVTVMSETHSLSEFAWHGVDGAHPLGSERGAHAARQLARVYRAIDDGIGELVGGTGDDTNIVVFSLDGIRAGHGDLPSIVLLPELMHRLAFGSGLLRDPDQDAWRRAGFPPVIPRREVPWRVSMDEYLVEPLARDMRSRVTRHPVYQRVRRAGLARRALTRVRGVQHGALGLPIPSESRGADARPQRESTRDMLFIGNYQPYWPRMRAFALPTFGDGYVRVNLVGREEHGVVAPADYRRVCDEVESMLADIRNPRTGNAAVLDVERVGGDPLDRYADLVVRWSEPIDAFEHPAVGTIGPFPLHRTGTHADGGFAWIAGPGVAPGDGAEGSVVDLPPTLLDLLGRPVPAGVVGTSLLGARTGASPGVPSLSATGR